MHYTLTYIAPMTAGKVSAALSFAMSLLFLIPMFLFSMVAGDVGLPIFALLFFPVLYLIFGFIFGLLGAFVYNLVATHVGGLELNFNTD